MDGKERQVQPEKLVVVGEEEELHNNRVTLDGQNPHVTHIVPNIPPRRLPLRTLRHNRTPITNITHNVKITKLYPIPLIQELLGHNPI